MDLPIDDAKAMASIFTILKEFNHPFAIVGQAAHRWMGCGGCTDGAIDMLIRDDQLTSITTSLIQSGNWSYLDDCPDRDTSNLNSDLEQEAFLDYCNDADAVLELASDTNLQWAFTYIRLWSEKTFHLKVDGNEWVRVPALFSGKALLAQERFHPASDRTDGWFFGPTRLSRCNDGLLYAGKVDGNSILIPSIPSYLDALVYHVTRYTTSKPRLSCVSQWQIRNLTRYLYLELPERRNQILFEVEAETERFLDKYLLNYKRKPHYVLSNEGEVVRVRDNSPKSFPESFKYYPSKSVE